jgi:hypothetical protein
MHVRWQRLQLEDEMEGVSIEKVELIWSYCHTEEILDELCTLRRSVAVR